ncbi:protein mono-ADP-ribosyltransferase PARP12-like isoform X2 [Hoplias malabaricus]|uniref:protein mono-ADP-ribosyltransferase PARP12-like isoform X2 n=1 Tax=Hoplias malabaricus TaxID=27720 RepID=UPI003462623B
MYGGIMAAEAVIKILCESDGSMEYERLLDITLSLPHAQDLDTIVGNSEYFTVIQRNDCKCVIATTTLKLCKNRECEGTCKDLHFCKFAFLGECSRRRCDYGHSLESEHNSRVLRERSLLGLSKDELRVLLLQNDTTLLPHVCVSYNKGCGEYGNCPDKEACPRLHICERYLKGTCDGSSECRRCHDFYEPHPMKTLQSRAVPSQLIGSLLFVYKNILALKELGSARGGTGARNKVDTKFINRGRVPESLQRNAENVICLSFVKGYCKYGDKCWRVHFDVPYKWEVEVDQVWMALPENEAIERDYCDPVKIHSAGVEPVCFDTMTLGLHRVRRLSTESSVVEPNFVLTTKWNWFWENEYQRWIKYGSIKEMHRLSSITTEDLEQKYLQFLKDRNSAVVKFSAGKHVYELNFRDMKQRNETSGTERVVRRRPAFCSLFDVQTARTRRGAHSSSYKGVPGFWNKSAIPDTGFQRVPLSPSDKDYVRTQEHFYKTMMDATVLKIERVQNKELWEDFQTKRDRMRKANKDKKYAEGERWLFHGTKSTHINAICLQNFDMRVSGVNATVYGQGSYFARDAKYSSDYTDKYGEKYMFECRVLVGQYTKGASSFRRPPAKDASGALYDSCVNDLREPSIFVVFDKAQVYPEFLITYNDKKTAETLFQSSVGTLVHSLAQSTTTDITPTSAHTALTDSSKCAYSEPETNVSELGNMTFLNSLIKNHPTSSSPTNVEPALSALSTTVVKNHPSLPEKIAPSCVLLLDDTLEENTNPKQTSASEGDQLSQLQKLPNLKPLPQTQFSTSKLTSKLISMSDDQQLISCKAVLSADTVHSESAKIQKQFMSSRTTAQTPQSLPQDSRNSLTLSSIDFDLRTDFLDPVTTQKSSSSKTSPFASSDPLPSAKASTCKSSLLGNTADTESSKIQKQFVSSSTSKQTPQGQDSRKSPTLSSIDSVFSDPEFEILDPVPTQLSSLSKTNLFDRSPDPFPSAKTSTSKSSLSGNTTHSESDKNYKSLVSNNTHDFTLKTPHTFSARFTKISSLDAGFSEVDTLDVQEIPSSKIRSSCSDNFPAPSLTAKQSGVSQLYKASSRSAENRSYSCGSLSRSSEASSHQAASSSSVRAQTVLTRSPQQKTTHTNIHSPPTPPQQKIKSGKSECVVQ